MAKRRAPDVIIEVKSGTAYVHVKLNSNIIIRVIDYDNEPDRKEPDLSDYREYMY